MNSTRTLQYAAVAEAVTLATLVCIAVPLKHIAGISVATSIIGPIHGVFFLLFIWLVVRSWGEGVIDGRAVLRLSVGAMIPFAGFINERWLHRRFAQETA